MLEKKLQITLAAARVNAGFTQEEVAKKMGISKQTIINWEKGKNIPGIPEMEMMSKIYNMPQDYIFLPSYSTKSRVPVLQETRDFQELESLKYNKDNETVVATFWYGAVKTANVHMDSGTSMIRDIIKQIR